MEINSLMLFGSCARKDYNENSDVDLLAMINKGKSTKKSFESFIVNYYSKSQLIQMTKEGSLFIWHLVTEGKMLFDKNETLMKILNKFELKKNYEKEKQLATDIGWLLFSKGVKNNQITVNILLYSIRTIVLTYLAKQDIPSFSKNDMINHFNDPLFIKLMDLKYKNGLTKYDLDILKQFLSKYGGKKPNWLYQPIDMIVKKKDINDFIKIRSNQLLKSSSKFDFNIYHH